MGIRKKILIIHPVLAPYRIDFLNHLSEYFDIYLLLYKENLEDNEFDQLELQNSLKFKKKVLYKVINFMGRTIPYNFISEVREYRPDIIICSEFSPVNNLMMIYRKVLNYPFKVMSLTDDNEHMLHRSGSLLRRFNRDFLCRYIDGIITLDIPDVTSFYKKKVKSGIAIGIHHLVRDQRIFRDQLNKLILVNNDHKLYSIDKKKLLYVGRLAKEKRLDILVNAISQIVRSRTDIIVYIVGAGKERSNLTALIKNLNLEKFIILEGRKEGSDLLQYYILCDLLILPSRYEPFGAVVNEALLSGLPVICSNYVGAKCLITEGINGSIFNFEKRHSLIDSINGWLSRIHENSEYANKEVLTTVNAKDEVVKLVEFINTI